MDLGLRQRRVAEILGAIPWTYLLWEHDRTRPTPRFVPALLRFLGYNPFPKGVTLQERLRSARRALGLSLAGLAGRLGVDESTITKWEAGQHGPSVKCWTRILEVIGQEDIGPDEGKE